VTLERTRIAEDLREAVRGELLFDDLARSLYSTDASIFQVEPLGIIVPIDEADVQATVRYAREHGLSVTARGAGTGMAGESLTSGLLLDFSRVQAGVVYRELQEELAKVGRRFAPDTASGAQCTLGGMFANNSSGARAMKHGYTRDHLVAVRTVLADGEVVEWGREPIAAEAVLPPKKQAVVRAVADLITREREVIIGCQPRTRFNRCGYLLHDVVTDGYLDVAKLLCGSEGTLALATEITVRTIPLPADRAMAWLGFGSMEAAAAAVRDCLPAFPSSCELLDRRLLTLACGTQSPYQKLVTPATEAVLLVEFESETPGKAGRAAQRLARLFLNHPDLTTSTAALTEEDVDQLWQLRNQALPMLHAAATRAVPIPLIEDVGVPVEHLPTYLHRLQELLQKHETTASFLIHAGAGQVHTRPLLNWNDAAALRRLPALAEEVHQWALDLGGTISTQHGVGIARSPWVGVQYGRLHQVFKELKAIFDPHDLLNPGKIVTGDASALSSKLRWKPRAETVPGAAAVDAAGDA
jgi:FAD/FMN-containing dehydrogenase